MKKLLLSLALLLLASMTQATETVSFRFSDPRIIYSTGTNYLVFDIQMKASLGNTYLYSSQIICNVSSGNFNTTIAPACIEGFTDGTYGFPVPQDKYSVTANWNSGNINIAILANTNFNGQSPSGGAYALVTSSWQKLLTVYLVMSSSTGTAGISFKTASMNGYQKYATGTGPNYSDYYSIPNSYEGNDFSDLYMARIYSAGSGWTQYGGTVNWAQFVNTSVWDTSVSAAQISGTTAGTECCVQNLIIHKNGRLKLDADHPLTVSGNTILQSASGIWITSGAYGTGSFKNTGTISYSNGGSFKIERYFTGSSWHYFTSPVQNAVSGVFLGDFLRSWEEVSNNWSPWIIGTSEPLEVMRGYEVWLGGTSGTRTFTGRVNTGSISKTMTYTASGGGGWNLIGNPYPSAQDMGTAASVVPGWTWPAETDRVAYYLTSANGITYQYQSYSWGTGLGTGAASQYIPAMQGYFVKTNSGTPTISINNSTRVHNSQVFVKQGDQLENLLRMTSSGKQYTDEYILRFAEGFSAGFDHDYDAYKFSNSDSIPSVFTYDEEQTPLSIDIRNFTSQNTIVKMGFKSGYSGTFNLEAVNIENFQHDIGIILEDTKEHNFTDLRLNPLYSFEYEKGEEPARFILHFNNPVFGYTESEAASLKIYSYEDDVYVKSLGIQPGLL
ncbi:MAG: hypothetical protein ACM3N9_06685 [Syntrophothermus sp.]